MTTLVPYGKENVYEVREHVWIETLMQGLASPVSLDIMAPEPWTLDSVRQDDPGEPAGSQ